MRKHLIRALKSAFFLLITLYIAQRYLPFESLSSRYPFAVDRSAHTTAKQHVNPTSDLTGNRASTEHASATTDQSGKESIAQLPLAAQSPVATTETSGRLSPSANPSKGSPNHVEETGHGSKIIVMAKLQNEDTDWVTRELPE